jgi:hypothetical protein
MKFGFLGAAITALALPCLALSAVAQGKQNFTLVNQTGYDISEVYVSPANSSDWEEDVLGEDILKNRDDVEITFKRNTRQCLWDMKVVYDDDDSSAEWSDIDLCKVSQVTIHYNRKADKTSATFR